MVTSTRIFSFGLGHYPSRSLVKGLARATNGRFIFIPPNTSVDVYVGEQLQKALQSSIINIQVKWNLGAAVTTNVPTKIPPVYVNDRLIVYALLEDKSTLFDHNSSVELKTEQYRLGEAKVTRLPSVSDNEMIARFAAKALIFELQHSKLPSSSSKKNVTGSMQRRFQTHQQIIESNKEDELNKEMIKNQIIELSLKYNILSPHTAFVGIEKRMNASNDNMVLREVPIQISADDQHLQIQHQFYSSPTVSMMNRNSPTAYYSTNYSATTALNSINNDLVCCCQSIDPPNISSISMNEYASDADLVSLEQEDFINTATDNVWPTNDQDIVRHLINKQKFDGSWDLDSKSIEHLTGKPLTDFHKTTNDQMFITAVVIIVLETCFPSFSSMWHGIVQKARKYLIDGLGKDMKKLDALFEDIGKQF